MAKVTVILTSYNKPETVGNAINSVINQTFHDWELFIMDDSSNKETKDVIFSFLDDNRIHYYNSNISDEDRFKTTRYAVLINEAISHSDGEYITYITDDNHYENNRLEIMVDYLQANRHVSIVYSKQKICFMDENLMTISEKIRETEGILLHPENVVDHCSVMHRRTVAEKVLEKYGSYWNISPDCWHNGDAAFWKRLSEFQLFYPINMVLDTNIVGPHSFQSLNVFLPEKIPNGTLVKGLTNTIYLIEGQFRRKLTEKMYRELNYQYRSIISIPDPVLFKYKEGLIIDEKVVNNPSSFPNQRLIQLENNETIYFIQNNQKRKVFNQYALHKYLFNKQEVICVSATFLNKLPEGPPIYANLLNTELLPEGLLWKRGASYYLSENNELHPIQLSVIKKLKLPLKTAIVLNRLEFSKWKIGTPFEWKFTR